MRPITNILLVLALICYVFLPFYDISLNGTVSGLDFTAGTITQSLSLGNVLLALLPFITCFGAIALNCLKKRWPEVTPDNDLGEGFSIIGLGIGHKLSFALTALSLLSALISLLPFKFNETIERAVDDTFEDGRRHVRKEFNRLESNLHRSHRAKQQTPPTAPPVEENTAAKPAEEEDKEDPSRFMPKNSGL